MPHRTCFVIMAIGDSSHAGGSITQADLRRRYDDLIKEAILKADPSLDVKRADDLAMPGTITSDILTRIMHSDLVVADITYPNPNVFYEVGLRHACRPGTILIREKDAPTVPFDLSHQRYIEYDTSASGLKDLADNLRQYLDHLKQTPGSPDNHFLELAKLTRFEFPRYEQTPEEPAELTAFMAMLKSPDMMEVLMRQASGEEVDQKELFTAMARNPETAGMIMKALATSGQISLMETKGPAKVGNRAARRAKHARKRKRGR